LREKNIKAVTMPHHSADANHPVDWNYHDPEYQCVVEVYQIRGSSEHEDCPHQIKDVTKLKGCFVKDGLSREYKMGFVASGDHNSMGTGLAVILVKDITPAGIVEALRARHCYATTGDKIFVDFRINGHLNGEEIQTSDNPHITAVIEGTDSLTDIVIFKDGKIIYQRDAMQLEGKKNFRVDFTDEHFAGSSYYYLRLIQKNNHIGWSSPIWVNKS